MKCVCVVVNYNDAGTVESLLDRLRGCSSVDATVLVDNASSEECVSALRAHVGDGVHLLECSDNGGYGRGNNVGIRYALDALGADVVLVSNPDVDFSDECVRMLLSVLQGEPSVGIAGPLSLTPLGLESRNVAWRQRSHWLESASCSVVLQRLLWPLYTYPPRSFRGRDSVRVDVLPGSLLAVRAAAYRDTGGFDERMFLFCEEKVICLSARRHGWQVALVPAAQYVHAESTSLTNAGVIGEAKTRIWLDSKRVFIRDHLAPGVLGRLWLRLMLRVGIREAAILARIRTILAGDGGRSDGVLSE